MGSVIQLFKGVTSVPRVANVAGRVLPVALYVPVQPDDVGSVIQLFKGVTSFVIEVHVVLSHLAARTCGNVVDAE